MPNCNGGQKGPLTNLCQYVYAGSQVGKGAMEGDVLFLQSDKAGGEEGGAYVFHVISMGKREGVMGRGKRGKKVAIELIVLENNRRVEWRVMVEKNNI